LPLGNVAVRVVDQRGVQDQLAQLGQRAQDGEPVRVDVVDECPVNA